MVAPKLRGVVENIVYALIGLLLAFLFHRALGFALSTDMPVVAVVSTSMQHDNAEATHYTWLEENLGYNRSVIDSWPLAGGFSIGDMPVVVGSTDYEVGDVIVYTVKGQPAPIIHRIVLINPDGTYQTKGDNNPYQWPYELKVRKEQIHGKVVFVIPWLGWPKVLFDGLLRLIL